MIVNLAFLFDCDGIAPSSSRIPDCDMIRNPESFSACDGAASASFRPDEVPQGSETDDALASRLANDQVLPGHDGRGIAAGVAVAIPVEQAAGRVGDTPRARAADRQAERMVEVDAPLGPE